MSQVGLVMLSRMLVAGQCAHLLAPNPTAPAPVSSFCSVAWYTREPVASPNGFGCCGHTHAPAPATAPATGSNVSWVGVLSLWYEYAELLPTATSSGIVASLAATLKVK